MLGVDAGQKFIVKAVKEDESIVHARLAAEPNLPPQEKRRIRKKNRCVVTGKFFR